MKNRFLLTSLMLLFVITASAQKFDGAWKINAAKSTVPTDQLYLSKINFKVKGDSLYTTRYYQSPDGQEYPFDEVLTLDGTEHKLTIYDMPRVTKASKGENGAIVIESKTTFYGNGGEDNLTAKETWKVDGNTLVQDFTNQMSGQEFKGTFYYMK
ncbi:MAG TPA: hypothetical protein VHO68_11020 [Bacteroidales bacterium]|nr:hypothetical protein [Bacteroidales bacterium]